MNIDALHSIPSAAEILRTPPGELPALLAKRKRVAIQTARFFAMGCHEACNRMPTKRCRFSERKPTADELRRGKALRALLGARNASQKRGGN